MCSTSTLGKLALQNVMLLKVMWMKALHAYRLGEAIKKARIEQNLTQEQLGERIGVKRAQISRLERGYSITIPTMRRVFKALGVVTATIDLGIAGKVALW